MNGSNPHNTRLQSHLRVEPRGRAAGARSRSPSPAAPGGAFFPTSSVTTPASPTFHDAPEGPVNTTMPVSEELKAVAEAAAAAAATAAITAMQANLQAMTTSVSNAGARRKKPEIPAFNKRHIDIWIRRIESAFEREGVTAPNEKFAHLESKIGVDEDPKISEFLYGAKTETQWREFIDYLKQQYGKTKAQMAGSIIDGTSRDGRKPSQLLAIIKDKAGTVSLDDVMKEMVIRQLPPEVHRTILDASEDLNAEETAKMADRYFGPDGKPLHKSSSAINAIEDLPETTNSEDKDEEDVNAIGGRFKPRGPYTPAFPSSRPQQRNNFTKGPSQHPQNRQNNNGYNNNNNKPSGKNWVCHYHYKFGDKAQKCEPGCSKAPKGQAGRRT